MPTRRRILIASGYDWNDPGNGAAAALRAGVDALAAAGVDVDVESAPRHLVAPSMSAERSQMVLLRNVEQRLAQNPSYDRLLVQTAGSAALRLFALAQRAGVSTAYRIGGLYARSDREAVRTAALEADRVLVPSAFVARYYRDAWGIACHAAIPPVTPVRLDPRRPEARELVYLSPCAAKGVGFFRRLARRLMDLGARIPIRVIEGRGDLRTIQPLVRHARVIGYPLTVTEGVVPRGELFGRARLLVVCSHAEPLGRAATESLAHGVPCLVSDRGGLPEVSPDRVLPIDGDDAVRRWVDTIIELFGASSTYLRWARSATECAARFSPQALAPVWRSAVA